MGTDDRPDYREHYAELTRRLQSLRPLFCTNESLSNPREYFDEMLGANEFEIALHALCYFLLEPTISGIGLTEIEKIEIAHRMMELDDGCASQIRAKCAD